MEDKSKSQKEEGLAWYVFSDDMYGLSLGQLYRFDLFDEAYIEGRVVFNDGVSAIIKVTDRYAEGESLVLDYNEVKSFFPSFKDNEAQKSKEYLCLDVEGEYNLFFRDPNTNKIMMHVYNEDNEHSLIPADVFAFRMNRIKKQLLLEVKRIEEKKKEEENQGGPVINIDLLSTAIEDMFKVYDKENDNDDSKLERSLNRTVHWLSNRNCAIISAWRGEYDRTQNDARNQALQQALRQFGYGVIRLKGCYAEVGKSAEKENSYFVVDIDDTKDFIDNIYKLSEHYKQDSFLYKPENESTAYLIGTNDEFGKGRIEVVGKARINSMSAEHYSELGSGRFSFE